MKCPFKLLDPQTGDVRDCPFFKSVDEMRENAQKVKVFCGLCMKAMYANNKQFKVVNTL